MSLSLWATSSTDIDRIHIVPPLVQIQTDPSKSLSRTNQYPINKEFKFTEHKTYHVCVHAQLCPTLCDSMDYNLPGSSKPGIVQARILEWVAMSRGSSPPRDQPASLASPALAGRFFTTVRLGSPRRTIEDYKAQELIPCSPCNTPILPITKPNDWG